MKTDLNTATSWIQERLGKDQKVSRCPFVCVGYVLNEMERISILNFFVLCRLAKQPES